MEYFIAVLNKRNGDIELSQRVIEELSQQNKVRPFNYRVIANAYLDKIEIYYSMGEKLDKCYESYLKATEYYRKGWNEDSTYVAMLQMVALGILLDVPNEYYDVMVGYVEKSDRSSSYEDWKPDALLWFMINYKKIGKAVPEKAMLPMYNEVVALTKLQKPEAEKAMKIYLEKWYILNRDAPWYDSHKKSGLAYWGYWCWEAGAISKIMGLDDSSYKDSPYYPYDMVHPEGGGKMYTDFNVLDV